MDKETEKPLQAKSAVATEVEYNVPELSLIHIYSWSFKCGKSSDSHLEYSRAKGIRNPKF